MTDISKITLPNDISYDLKDSEARSKINSRVIASKTQPTNQRTGDIWLILAEKPNPSSSGDSQLVPAEGQYIPV